MSLYYSFKNYEEKCSKAKNKMFLPLMFGHTNNGELFIDDLAKMPHLLVAGSPGSGKSVFIQTSLIHLLLKFKPDELKLILVDIKKCQLEPFKNLPHLLFPIFNKPNDIPNVLDRLIEEMKLRYKYFAKCGVRNIQQFNKKRKTNKKEISDSLPYIIFVIDELGDLMYNLKDEIETNIIRLLQLAGETGIHIIIATQRITTNIITGLIKANIPARVAFGTTTSIESRIILDEIGCEKLRGRVEMFYKKTRAKNLIRIQGTYIHEEELSDAINFIKIEKTQLKNQSKINLIKEENYELERN